MRAAALIYPNIREPYIGPTECTINTHRSLTLGLISLATTRVILASVPRSVSPSTVEAYFGHVISTHNKTEYLLDPPSPSTTTTHTHTHTRAHLILAFGPQSLPTTQLSIALGSLSLITSLNLDFGPTHCIHNTFESRFGPTHASIRVTHTSALFSPCSFYTTGSYVFTHLR